MRIAQISTVDTPVRRDHSSSVEQLSWILARELTAMGHDVTTFGAAGSTVAGNFCETLPGTYGENGSPEDWRLCEWINIARALEHSREFDVIHSHGYLLGLPFDAHVSTPMVHTLHIHPYDDSLRLRAMFPNAKIVGISHFQWSEIPDIPPIAIIPHGIDVEQFTFRAAPSDYLAFLGRFIPDKGVLTAIRSARSLGIPLKLAGPRNDYFDEVIAKEVDGRNVEYVGAVTGDSRDSFLGAAQALLYPIEAPEPFGLVQIEAMMCGTPVVATRIGAVPEIVDDGVTGFTASDPGDFISQIPRAIALQRATVRSTAEGRFSATAMAKAHAALYESLWNP
jgi:glycosyltransferase involved in cell wall biosynthesis